MFDFARFTGAIPALVACRIKRLYITRAAKKKIKGGALLVSNHTGFFDIIYLMTAVWYRRLHFVTIKELFEKKWGRIWFKYFGQCFAIDRDHPEMSVIRDIVAHLKAEKVVAMFPEGHIFEGDGSGNMDEFKTGAAAIATLAGKPIVPVYIYRRNSAWERLKIAFGEPIYVDEERRKQSPLTYRTELTQLIYDKEKELQEFCERKYGKRN